MVIYYGTVYEIGHSWEYRRLPTGIGNKQVEFLETIKVITTECMSAAGNQLSTRTLNLQLCEPSTLSHFRQTIAMLGNHYQKQRVARQSS
jgi:hypothetical protein